MEQKNEKRTPIPLSVFEDFVETRDEALRNKLIEEYLYMVDILVRKYLGKGIEYDDLYQVGAMALIKAVDRFDPSKGFTFTSFATPTILGEIKKHFRDKGWSMKVPRRLKEIAGSIPKAKETLQTKLGRPPTPKEIAEELELTEKDVLQAMEASLAYTSFSISQTYDDDSEGLMFEKYFAMDESGYDTVENREVIEEVLKNLSDTNRYIFKKRFMEGLTQGEIAKELGISQMSISRAEKTIRKEFEKGIKVS